MPLRESGGSDVWKSGVLIGYRSSLRRSGLFEPLKEIIKNPNYSQYFRQFIFSKVGKSKTSMRRLRMMQHYKYVFRIHRKTQQDVLSLEEKDY